MMLEQPALIDLPEPTSTSTDRRAERSTENLPPGTGPRAVGSYVRLRSPGVVAERTTGEPDFRRLEGMDLDLTGSPARRPMADTYAPALGMAW
jgi:hypothetical protein